MTDRDEAVKILGQAGFKVRRLTRRMCVVERECSTAQLASLAANIAKGLDNVSRETTEGG
jgi:hypothetical protein